MFKIIPSIDILNSKCVRLLNGNFNHQTVYHENPLVVAKLLYDNGFKDLHIVDLDGVLAKKVINYKLLEQISSQTEFKINFSGGIRNTEEIQTILNYKVATVSIGSVAVSDKSLFRKWIIDFGSDKINLSTDTNNGKIFINGWIESSNIMIKDFIQKYLIFGIKTIICTDISKDGTLEGPSFELYRTIIQNFPKISLIASGGIGTLDDVIKLKEIGCSGVIIGKAIYTGKIKLHELHKLL
jgi:phosphoribosylformimino-5-aminoimidazole carboxamide ribotide isomerase